jgi:hypothetical protein
MVILGIVLLVLGYFFHVPVLTTLGIVLLVIGAILWILGSIGRPVAGRRYWYLPLRPITTIARLLRQSRVSFHRARIGSS